MERDVYLFRNLPDSFGRQIQLCFVEALEDKPDIESAISDFKDFFETNSELFPENLKRLVIKTLFAIAGAFFI